MAASIKQKVDSFVEIDNCNANIVSGITVDKIFIAANFHNNEDILPNFSEQLLDLLRILNPENVYVSLFENGSKDNTKFLLHALRSDLDAKGIPNTIIINDSPKNETNTGRIPYMARLRNKLLEPLLEQTEKGNKFDYILFFNDVIWTASDILVLLETNDRNYDAACAMDFYWTFYDTFATRELPSSRMRYPWPPNPYFPYFYDKAVQQKLYNNDPVRVFSCWNGVTVMNAEPFVKHNVRFRALFKDKELKFDASECCLIYSDFRKLGYDKVFVNPNVRVAYEYRFYLWSKYILPLIDFLFQYFHHPTPPLLHSDREMQMQEMMSDLMRFNVDEFDKTCVQTFL
ncbi:5878_t:CDS:2 [Acaulospora morrowiae]|uniref:5878_t:CDS:1 n=1 Tax=Acaulospora morrowiae TaxID=94023 RepID=A0A9N9HB97_9GLOM|nr:5878_t:CDS:2 [Acaulospora morrowiae]